MHRVCMTGCPIAAASHIFVHCACGVLYDVGFGTSVALAGAMGARFLRTGKVMPAGLLMAGGVAGSLYNWGKYQEWTGA